MTSKPTTTMSHAANEIARKRAVAYYRCTAAEGDESIESQREQVRKWAEKHGIEIVREFEDRGESGAHTEPRPGFDELKDCVDQDRDFRYILCRDPSRWCRFVDRDMAASYYGKCLKAGKRVVYTALDMPPEAESLYSAYFHFDRWLAAPRCCQHGAKARRGRMRATQKGYWVGGTPPCGMRRLLLDGKGKPLRLLEPGERKIVHNHRVALVAGTPAEVAAVRRIFHEFVDLGYSMALIAEGLNAKRVPSPGRGAWSARKVLACLRTKAYASPITYRRKRKRKISRRGKTPDQWVHTPKASEGLISLEQFQRALEMLP